MVICPRFIKVKVPFLLLRIGLPASDSPVDSDDHQVATSQWCTSTIQKLASFTVSVLRENTQLREYTTTTGTTKAGTPRSQASADEAGGQPMKLGVVQRGIINGIPFYLGIFSASVLGIFSAFLFPGLRQEGRKEGREGRKEGRKEGRTDRQTGRQAGRKEGRKEGQTDRQAGRQAGRKEGRK